MSLAQVQVCMGEAATTPLEHERDLVERAKHDREAFALLYRQHYRTLSSYVYRRVGDVHATEDLGADVFLTALRTLPRFRYRGVPLRFWLLRIATNAVNHWARGQRRRMVGHIEPDQIAAPASDPASSSGEVDKEQARRALLSLSPKHQTVLALRYFEGLAVEDVAAVIGCRTGTVKSRLARAREALRASLNRRR